MKTVTDRKVREIMGTPKITYVLYFVSAACIYFGLAIGFEGLKDYRIRGDVFGLYKMISGGSLLLSSVLWASFGVAISLLAEIRDHLSPSSKVARRAFTPS